MSTTMWEKDKEKKRQKGKKGKKSSNPRERKDHQMDSK